MTCTVMKGKNKNASLKYSLGEVNDLEKLLSSCVELKVMYSRESYYLAVTPEV